MTVFSPSDAALEGFRLTREHPVAILVWGLFYFLGVMVLGILMVIGLGPTFVSFVQSGGMESGDTAAFGQILEKAWPQFLLIVFLAVVLLSIVTTGVYRLVLRPHEPTPLKSHLKLGADEVRVTLTNLVMLLIGMLCLFAIAATAGLLAGGNARVVALFSLLLAGVMIWIGVRLSLAAPMTFGEGRLAIAASWRLTRGHFWRLLGMILLATIFYLVIWALVSVIAAVIITLGGGQEAITNFGSMSPVAFVALIATLFIQLVLPILQVMILHAPLAIAYRAIRQNDVVAD